jgi:hypothetical protein
MKRILLPLFVVASIALLAVAGKLAVTHVQVIADVRTTIVPLVAELPALERRHALLSQQVELAELQSALRVGSTEEKVRTYVLPEAFDVERMVALFDVFNLAIPGSDHVTSMSAVEFGTPEAAQSGLESMPIRVRFTADKQGSEELMRFFRFAGVLTIADTLSEAELSSLLTSVEADTPAGIVPLEQFLSTDLLTYSQNPKPFEERLRRSFLESDALLAIDELLRMPVLRDARSFLGGVAGMRISEQKLWPMPMLTVEEVHAVPGRAPGWQTLSFVLRTYRRTAAEERA